MRFSFLKIVASPTSSDGYAWRQFFRDSHLIGSITPGRVTNCHECRAKCCNASNNVHDFVAKNSTHSISRDFFGRFFQLSHHHRKQKIARVAAALWALGLVHFCLFNGLSLFVVHPCLHSLIVRVTQPSLPCFWLFEEKARNRRENPGKKHRVSRMPKNACEKSKPDFFSISAYCSDLGLFALKHRIFDKISTHSNHFTYTTFLSRVYSRVVSQLQVNCVVTQPNCLFFHSVLIVLMFDVVAVFIYSCTYA